MNIQTLVNTYAASPRNPPKGYGSISLGIEVASYRARRMDHYRALGNDYVQCATLAQADVIAMYGEPWVSVDEDGIPI
jgi:hypothetical protein